MTSNSNTTGSIYPVSESSSARESSKGKPILFVVDSDFDSFGGAERQAIVLAKSLKQRGIEVEFVIPTPDSTLELQSQFEGFQLTRIKYKQIKYLGAVLLITAFAAYILKNQHRFAFIHVHITKLFAATLGLLKPWLNVPVITKISGHYEFTGGVLDYRRKFSPLIHALRYFVRKLDYVHSVSLFTREVLLKNGFTEQQIQQIPNAVDLGRFELPGKTEDKFIDIGYCGRIEEVKGLEILFQAVAMIDEEMRRNVRIGIAGDGEHMEALKRLSDTLGLTDSIRFYGEIDDVPGFLAKLDIYVQPSYAEGLPNSVLEAMSSSLPVVASRISGNVDLVDNGVNGFLFRSGDVGEMSESLAQLIRDKSVRQRMGESGRSKMEEFYSTTSVSSKFVELYYRQ